jgi:hypothetical protein
MEVWRQLGDGSRPELFFRRLAFGGEIVPEMITTGKAGLGGSDRRQIGVRLGEKVADLERCGLWHAQDEA